MKHRDHPPAGRWRLAVLGALLLSAVSAAALSPAGTAAAGEAVPEPPIEIEADRADMDAERGISVYTGEARLTRGEMYITGDVMEVYTDAEGALERVVVMGRPALYHHHPIDQPQPIHGEAETIEYFAAGPERAVFQVAARFWQNQDEITGETIHVDLERQVVEARGSEGRRARTILYPAKRDEGSDSSP